MKEEGRKGKYWIKSVEGEEGPLGGKRRVEGVSLNFLKDKSCAYKVLLLKNVQAFSFEMY